MLVDDRCRHPQLGRQRADPAGGAAPLGARQGGDQREAEAEPHAAGAEMGQALVDPPCRQVGRHHGAKQYRHPRHVHPQQKDRDRRERAIDRLIGRHRADIEAEADLEDLDRARGDRSADQPVAPAHRAIGDDAIQEGAGDQLQDERHEAREQMRPAAGELIDRFRVDAGMPCRGIEIGRQSEAHADQQRPQGHQRPIGQDPLPPGASRGDPPQRVQLIFDGDQQQDPGAGDADNADRRRLGRRAGEILEPPGRLLADRRHEIAEDQAKQLLPHRGEIREDRQDAEHNDAERHQRDERRVAERAGGGKAAVLVEAVQRV